MNDFLIHNSIWWVLLSNGEEKISDNQYIDGVSDWLRLKKYCRDYNLAIEKMQIRFRDHYIDIPKAKHYFFRRMALGRFGKVNRQSPTFTYFLVSSTNNRNFVNIKYYLTPELQLMEEEDRKLDSEEESLI